MTSSFYLSLLIPIYSKSQQLVANQRNVSLHTTSATRPADVKKATGVLESTLADRHMSSAPRPANVCAHPLVGHAKLHSSTITSSAGVSALVARNAPRDKYGTLRHVAASARVSKSVPTLRSLTARSASADVPTREIAKALRYSTQQRANVNVPKS